MAVMERRLQVLIDHDRFDRLERESRGQQRPVAAVVRQAIDQYFDRDQAKRAAAGARLLNRPMPDGLEPDWPEIKRSFDDDLIRRFDG